MHACLVVPQTFDLAGENDVVAGPHGLVPDVPDELGWLAEPVVGGGCTSAGHEHGGICEDGYALSEAARLPCVRVGAVFAVRVPVRDEVAREMWPQHLCPNLFLLQFFLQGLPLSSLPLSR